ncbi:hypothetical protein JCM8097_005764 [Rhodosporidiobolus ruineniae]
MARPRSSRASPSTSASVLLLATLALQAAATPVHTLDKRLTDEGGYYNPTSNGGSWLTLARNTYPAGLGEPINVVVSAESDPLIMTDDGFFDWSESIEFGHECLGQSDGERQAANLGDGNGEINQTTLLRYNYGDPSLGTCWETINGGSHYRVWRQNGTAANSGAWFLASSVEKNLTLQHGIVDNGYDLGRDWVVNAATVSGGTKSPLTNRTFTTEVRNASGVGYFANVSVDQINHGIATDGIVAVLTVRVTSNGSVGDTSAAPVGTHALTRFDLARIALVGLFSVFALGILA